MFREIILPIFRSIRLCVTACGVMHPPRCCRPSAGNIVRLLVTIIFNAVNLGTVLTPSLYKNCSTFHILNYVLMNHDSCIEVSVWMWNKQMYMNIFHYESGEPPTGTCYGRWRTQEFCSGRGGVQQIQLRTERTGIWGRQPLSQGFWRQL